MAKEKKKWSTRKPVQDCDHLGYIECPRCGVQYVCIVDGYFDAPECLEENCPRFNKKTGRFLKEPSR